MADDDIAAFVAAHPPLPGLSAHQMIDVWEGLAALADVQAIATDADAHTERAHLEHGAGSRRQLAAAVRWVEAHHGREVADAFVAYLSNASNGKGRKATPPKP